MADGDLWALPATELLERYRSKSLSPVEVTEAILARIEASGTGAQCLCDADAGAGDRERLARLSGRIWTERPDASPASWSVIKDLDADEGDQVDVRLAALRIVRPGGGHADGRAVDGGRDGHAGQDDDAGIRLGARLGQSGERPGPNPGIPISRPVVRAAGRGQR
ncbi:MAG: hypothetical protein R3A46_19705 [Thermomicrobiales bacterium]